MQTGKPCGYTAAKPIPVASGTSWPMPVNSPVILTAGWPMTLATKQRCCRWRGRRCPGATGYLATSGSGREFNDLVGHIGGPGQDGESNNEQTKSNGQHASQQAFYRQHEHIPRAGWPTSIDRLFGLTNPAAVIGRPL